MVEWVQVLEWMSGGSLKERMECSFRHGLDIDSASCYTAQVCTLHCPTVVVVSVVVVSALVVSALGARFEL